ncbi:MAG TPA: type II TA system antitoxin MqsA family protein [Pirellulales bacterium]|nr:type II TA system antitoxin MqsA family protein [Pirellulales bacterium]
MNHEQAMLAQRDASAFHNGCSRCGEVGIETRIVEDNFQYGVGDEAVSLRVEVPLRICAKCGFEFLDDEAEDIRHVAVCRHLGVMTPTEIQRLRDRLQLTEAEFARITRLGPATVSRWERGASVQNAAYDQYLYLLSFPENVERLKSRVTPSTSP